MTHQYACVSGGSYLPSQWGWTGRLSIVLIRPAGSAFEEVEKGP